VTRPTLEDRFEYVAALVFVRLVRFLPPRLVWWLARALGVVLFDVVRYRRDVVLANLGGHLAGTGSGEAGAPRGGRRHASLGRECLAGFVGAIADLARLPIVDDRYIRENIETEGLEHLDGALKAGRGAVLVTGHFGSWELMGCVISRLGYPIKFVVGVQRNPLVQRLMNDLRRSCGIGVIEPDALLSASRALRSNQFLAMLSDQDVGERGVPGVFVEFLGEQASTPRGAAQFSILARAPIIPGFIVRTGAATHRIVIEPPILPPEGRGEAEIRELTAAYTRVIEAYVQRYPGQWLWTHRRWKTRPT
jgi:KDO2-lipid IV(A) lauroyltransferase